MVKEGDSCSRGRGFKSHCRILDGHLVHQFDVKCLFEKDLKGTKKRPGMAHLITLFKLL